VTSPANRFYDRIRHGAADRASETSAVAGFDHLRGHKYCLLITYRRDGREVPTPVWFGLAGGRLYVRSDADALKVRRIRSNPRVRVAPCTARGKPLGPPADGTARLLDQSADADLAERALEANYGLGRKLYRRTLSTADATYIEVAPAGQH
jgi:PPOX class probable F420-dependent enzyme